MTTAVLSIGSNLGNTFEHLQTAVTKISSHPKITNVRTSSLYKTAPVGGVEQDDFLNAVVEMETELSAPQLLEFAQQLENEAARVREVRWGPRTLDVDILTYGLEISATEALTIPHPRIAERAFVIVPWFELNPDAQIPAVGSLKDVYERISKDGVQLNSDMELHV